MKKFKLKKRRYRPQKVYSPEKMLRMFVDAELRPFGVKMSDVEGEENGIIDGKKWFEYYTFKTKSQEEVWKEYCSRIFRRHAYPWYVEKRRFNKEFCWISLQYGLLAEWYVLEKSKNQIKLKEDEDKSNS